MRYHAIWALVFGMAGASAHASDPLFDKMQGAWSAEGVRLFPGGTAQSRERVEIQAQVVSQVDAATGRLSSKNVLEETPYDSAGVAHEKRHYERTYWVERDPSVNNAYLLGVFEKGREKGAGSRGFLGQDGSFRVTQDFGNGWHIDSETLFVNDSETHYHEVFWQGARKSAETELVYRRIHFE